MSGFITQLSAKNFTSFAELELDLGRLNVLVGPNGAGKSNVLKAINFLGDLHREELGAVIRKRGGRDRLQFRGATGNSTELGVTAVFSELANENAPDRYDLRLEWQDGLFDVHRQETFTFKRTAGRGRRLKVHGSEFVASYDDADEVIDREELRGDALMFSTLPKLPAWQGAVQIEQLATLFAGFRNLDIAVDQARLPNRLDLNGTHALLDSRFEPLDATGSNLSRSLLSLRSFDPDRFARLQDDVAEIVPGFGAFTFSPISGGSDSMRIGFTERGFPDDTPLDDVSFGTVRLIALLLVLHDPDPPALTGIEEIDHGLHPHALDLIVERVREASAHTQILMTSHSPTLVNRLEPSEIVVCERDPETNESIIPAISSDEVAEMEAATEGELQLGELWFSGTLGGGLV